MVEPERSGFLDVEKAIDSLMETLREIFAEPAVSPGNQRLLDAALKIGRLSAPGDYSPDSAMHLGFGAKSLKCNLFVSDIFNEAFGSGAKSKDRIEGKNGPMHTTVIWGGGLENLGCREVDQPARGDTFLTEPWGPNGHTGQVTGYHLGGFYITGTSAREKGIDRNHRVAFHAGPFGYRNFPNVLREVRFYRCDRMHGIRNRKH